MIGPHSDINKIGLFLLFIPFLLWGCQSNEPTMNSSHQKLYPWRSKQGKFGFCDRTGKIVITPQYDEAYLFHHGLAVVAKDGKYGVINTENEAVLPLKYAAAQMNVYAGIPTVITKKEYNAWWQVWNWKILPGWNILGGSTGPLLVTRVPKAKWSVYALNPQKELWSQKRMDTESAMGTTQYWKEHWEPSRIIPDDIKVSHTDRLLAVQHKLYQKQKSGRLKLMTRNFVHFVSDTTILVQNGTSYYITHLNGDPVHDETYSLKDGIPFQTAGGEQVVIEQTGAMGRSYPVVRNAIYENEKGQIFLASNFSQPFPEVVSDYQSPHDTLTARAILQKASLITRFTPTDYFVVLSSAGSGESRGWNTYFLNGDGQWNTKIPVYEGARRILGDGRIIYERAEPKGVLKSDFSFHEMPLTRIVPSDAHPDWYLGRDTTSQKFGVYDASEDRWQVPPEYHYLQQEVVPGIAIYVAEKEDSTARTGGHSLIDIKENRKITPPLYDRIERDGRVHRTIDGEELTFYINPKTGEEYREK